jgi:hypothetical protein
MQVIDVCLPLADTITYIFTAYGLDDVIGWSAQ